MRDFSSVYDNTPISDSALEDKYTLAEYSVAGAFLIDGRCFPGIRRILPDGSAFASRFCGSLYDAACQAADEGEPLDPVIISKRCPEVSNQFIHDLMDTTPTAANAEFYARRVLEGSQRRALAKIGQQLMESPDSVEEIITQANSALSELSTAASQETLDSGMTSLMQLREELEDGTRCVLSTGFPSLDSLLGGLQPGGLYIIGARPSVGKSAFGIALADMLAAKSRVLFLSLEMSKSEINARRVAAFSDTLPSYQTILAKPHFTEEQNIDFCRTSAELAGRPLLIRQESHLSVGKAGSIARLAGVQVLIVDYVGLMESPLKTEYERITQISGDLKRTAQSLNIVVIALCQLNRSTEQTKGCRPMLSHLRSSGALEQDADAVLLLHRPEQGTKEPAEPLEISVAKNRHGSTGCARLRFYPATNRFEDSAVVGGRTITVKSWRPQ